MGCTESESQVFRHDFLIIMKASDILYYIILLLIDRCNRVEQIVCITSKLIGLLCHIVFGFALIYNKILHVSRALLASVLIDGNNS